MKIIKKGGHRLLESDPDTARVVSEMLIDLEKTQEVTLDKLHYALSDFSLFEGWKLKGWPVITIINGEIVMKEGNIIGKPGIGSYLPRSA